MADDDDDPSDEQKKVLVRPISVPCQRLPESRVNAQNSRGAVADDAESSHMPRAAEARREAWDHLAKVFSYFRTHAKSKN